MVNCLRAFVVAEHAVHNFSAVAHGAKRKLPIITYIDATRVSRCLTSDRSVLFQAYVKLLPEGSPQARLAEAAGLHRRRLIL